MIEVGDSVQLRGHLPFHKVSSEEDLPGNRGNYSGSSNLVGPIRSPLAKPTSPPSH